MHLHTSVILTRFLYSQKLDDNAYLRTLPDADLLGLIHDKMWQPPSLQLQSFTRL
jgi:malate dehydrogenase (oxaloacetate-decarboxylating)(NADP+)